MSDLEDRDLAYLANTGEVGRRAVEEIRRRRAAGVAVSDPRSDRFRFHAAHRELERRRRRDEELALHLPAIMARLQSLAADAVLDLRAPAEPVADRGDWARDPAIDWTGVGGWHP